MGAGLPYKYMEGRQAGPPRAAKWFLTLFLLHTEWRAELSARCRHDARDPFVTRVLPAIKVTWFSPTTRLLFIT